MLRIHMTLGHVDERDTAAVQDHGLEGYCSLLISTTINGLQLNHVNRAKVSGAIIYLGRAIESRLLPLLLVEGLQ